MEFNPHPRDVHRVVSSTRPPAQRVAGPPQYHLFLVKTVQCIAANVSRHSVRRVQRETSTAVIVRVATAEIIIMGVAVVAGEIVGITGEIVGIAAGKPFRRAHTTRQ